jgi:hypothetical protein
MELFGGRWNQEMVVGKFLDFFEVELIYMFREEADVLSIMTIDDNKTYSITYFK